MISRYVPNEVTCPVPVDVLALLLRSADEKVTETLAALPDAQRAALAAFCFSRSHLRSLAFRIAAQCDDIHLRAIGGRAIESLIEQSRNPSEFDVGPKVFARKSITLARSAA